MIYNPELLNQLLGKEVAELMDGTIEIEKSNGEKIFGLTVGDKLTFKFKNASGGPTRQFIITGE